MHLKDHEAAREQLLYALEQNKHHQTFASLAKIYLIENDIPSAINTYRAAIELVEQFVIIVPIYKAYYLSQQ